MDGESMESLFSPKRVSKCTPYSASLPMDIYAYKCKERKKLPNESDQ